MTQKTMLIGHEDVDALIDQELSPERHVGLLSAMRKDPHLADQVVDRAAMLDVLRGMKSELYDHDPKLRDMISSLMNRSKT